MRPGIRVEIKKNKEGVYSVEAYFGDDIFVCRAVRDKQDAIGCRNKAKELLDSIKVSKLKATLTDGEISKLSFDRYPASNHGYWKNTIRDTLRNEFKKTAKFIRDVFLSINLEQIHDEEEPE